MRARRIASSAAALCLIAVVVAAISEILFAASPSPDGTQLPPATSIVDNALATWTIATDGRILRNGVQASGGYGSKLLWSNSVISAFGTDNRWYSWTGSSWALKASPSGTRLPPAASIVDNSFTTWTIASDGRILRNGAQAAGGYGSIIDWTNNVLSVFGFDSKWYTWTGSSWAAAASPSLQPSPSGTRLPPASAVVDNSLASWTIASDGRILRNGVQAAGGYGSIIDWTNSALSVFGTDSRWYTWTGSSWVTQAPLLQTSADGTEIPPASAIIDSSLATWTIASDRRILRNGTNAGGGYGTDILWYGGSIYVQGTDARWYVWTGSSWSVFGPTKPGSSQPLPTGDYYVSPGQSIQSVLNSAAEGTTIVLNAGVHRMQSLTPRNGQKIVGAPGAVLSGARVLTAWGWNGSAWVVSGQTQQGPVSDSNAQGACRTGMPMCGYPEDLFFNNNPLLRVSSLGEGGPGRWFFDYNSDQIFVWDNPTGVNVETSVTGRAIGGYATGVTIRSVLVEKYAVPTGSAAVELGTGWTLENSEVRFNHFGGVGTGASSTARSNNVHHNGGLGFEGAGGGILIDSNEISYNGYAGYTSYWGAGGSKWVNTDHLTVRGNYSHHNSGPGLWTDINNIYTLYENNTTEDNERGGIFHELSYNATIRYNTCRRNGTAHDFPGWSTGAGIELIDSPNVEVYGNTLEDNWQGITGLDDQRGNGAYGPWVLTNLNVHDNTVTTHITTPGGGRTGIISLNGTAAFSSSANNHFWHNTYSLGSNPQYFIWYGDQTEVGWMGYGQDLDGKYYR